MGITGGCLGFLHTPREGTLISLNIYVRRLGSFFGVQNLNFNIFKGFQKNEYFLGMKILWIFFGSSQNWTVFRGHFYAF